LKHGDGSDVGPVESNNRSRTAIAGSWTRPELAALTALLAVGASLRIYGLTDHGLWIDEYGTWWAVAGENWSHCWHRVIAIHGQSPLYYGSTFERGAPMNTLASETHRLVPLNLMH